MNTTNKTANNFSQRSTEDKRLSCNSVCEQDIGPRHHLRESCPSQRTVVGLQIFGPETEDEHYKETLSRSQIHTGQRTATEIPE